MRDSKNKDDDNGLDSSNVSDMDSTNKAANMTWIGAVGIYGLNQLMA